MRLPLAVGLLIFLPITALGQIVSPAGTMDVMVSSQYAHIYAHTARNGMGGIQRNINLRSFSATVGIEYSLTDRLAFGVSVPYITSRYRGHAPHPDVAVDDGSMHGTLQDLQLDARYAWTRGDLVVSPFAGFRYPVRDYETMGHAAPGRGLQELELGVSAGRLIPLLPNAVVGANVSYVVSEAVEGIRVNRSHADLQLGYGVTSRLFVRGFGAWQRSHGGFDVPMAVTSEWFHHHDQLARTNHTRAGAGLIYSLTDTVNLHLGYATVLASSNSHMGRSVSVGTSWTIAPHRLFRKRQFSAGTAAAVYRTPAEGRL